MESCQKTLRLHPRCKTQSGLTAPQIDTRITRSTQASALNRAVTQEDGWPSPVATLAWRRHLRRREAVAVSALVALFGGGRVLFGRHATGQTPAFDSTDNESDADQIKQSVKGLISIENALFTSEVIADRDRRSGPGRAAVHLGKDQALAYARKGLEAPNEGMHVNVHARPKATDRDSDLDGVERTYAKSEGTARNRAFTAPSAAFTGSIS